MNVVPWRAVVDGVELAIRLTPRGGRATCDGIIDSDGHPYLKIRVSAPPVDNAANKALVEFLAKELKVPRSAITFLSGEKSRIKRLHIEGTDLVAAVEKLAR